MGAAGLLGVAGVAGVAGIVGNVGMTGTTCGASTMFGRRLSGPRSRTSCAGGNAWPPLARIASI